MAGFSCFATKITLFNQRIVYAVHPSPPFNAALAHATNQYLHELKQHILSANAKTQTDFLIIGDFNLSAFSPIYRDFIANSNLQRTTPRGLPTWLPFAIGIDQILISDTQNSADTNNINNIQVQPLAWVGSDHRGFLVTWK